MLFFSYIGARFADLEVLAADLLFFSRSKEKLIFLVLVISRSDWFLSCLRTDLSRSVKFQLLVCRSEYFWADLGQISHKSACFSAVRGCYSCLEPVYRCFYSRVAVSGREEHVFCICFSDSVYFSALLTCIYGFVVQHHAGRQPKVLWEELQYVEATYVGHFLV
jgi:hypothetical protein